MTATWIDSAAGLAAALPRVASARRLAVDVESNGMFVFAPRLCTVQIAAESTPGDVEVFLVDALAVDVAPLAAALANPGIEKIVHDATFDAAMLARAGAPLDHVFDTAIAARFLGHTATGLASVLLAETGVQLDKKLQTSDWAARPLPSDALAYLADDVVHLPGLATRLREKIVALDIEEELALECDHRLATAVAPEESLPPFARIKGFRSVGSDAERVLLRDIAAARDTLAAELDLPAGRLLSRDALLGLVAAVARGKVDLGRYVHHRQARPVVEAVLARAASASPLTDDERALFTAPPPPDRERLHRRRRAESLLSRFRKEAAAARGISEQVVLPGHLHREIAAQLADADAVDDVRAWLDTAPLGPKRRGLYTDAIVALREVLDRPEPPPAAEGASELEAGSD